MAPLLAELKARQLLEQHGLSAPPIDVFHLAERLSISVVEECLGDEVSGMLYREGDQAVIVINQDDHFVRRRFSVAHELGHYLLHSSPVFVDRRVRFRDSNSSTGTNREEIQANRFAAELLMPVGLVLDELYACRQQGLAPPDEELIEELASRFIVSKQAMEFRLANIGELGTF